MTHQDTMRLALDRAIMLCQWIAKTPHQRGSINGMAVQVEYELRGVWQAMLAAAPAAQPELPQKARPDFIAGYDAGMADALRKINTQEVK